MLTEWHEVRKEVNLKEVLLKGVILAGDRKCDRRSPEVGGCMFLIKEDRDRLPPWDTDKISRQLVCSGSGPCPGLPNETYQQVWTLLE